MNNSSHGLTSEEADAIRARVGVNRVEDRKQHGALRLFAAQFANPLVLILAGAGVVSGFAGEWMDAAIIVAVVIGSGVLGFVQEYSASAAVERLRARIAHKTIVVRDGREQSIPASEVVPGDIVLLAAGSLIPADGVVLEAKDFFVNQAVLTGETFPVEKRPGDIAASAPLAERTNAVFMGTNVRSGVARQLVTETGPRTEFGKIASRLELRAPRTEFERGIDAFGMMLGRAILVLILVVVAANILNAKPAVESLLFAVALAVGLAPELLPAIVTVTLSKGAQDMARHGVIVRRLSSIENLGSMDVLCTDKTGTLTEGVVSLDGALGEDGNASAEVLDLGIVNARLQTGLPNPLDEAIQSHPRSASLPPVPKADEVPYDFVRKRLTVVVDRGGGRHEIITKGALEPIVEICALDEARRESIVRRYGAWCDEGYRVLGVASIEVEARPAYSREDETGLQFRGFLLFMDPPKEGVTKTLADLRGLGVDVKVITGDSRGVAVHLARQVGLSAEAVLSGAEIQQMGDEALWQQAQRTSLFVQVDPNQKERIILALQKTGHVVGYMGDGINDAPALHAADVGISVEQAVDVAKEAADLVLLEHDLDVLRQGLVRGRNTFANTLKYILTTTSANFGNMLSMAGASLFLPFLPLLAKQILLNNFLSDIPGMTIANDSVDHEWVERPHRWNLEFIKRFMIVFGLVSGVFDYLTFGVLLLWFHASPEIFRTAWFIESLLTELVIALVVRTRRPFFRSRPGRALEISTGIAIVVTLVLPWTPVAGMFGLVALPKEVLFAICGITAMYVVAAELVKRYYPAVTDPGDVNQPAPT